MNALSIPDALDHGPLLLILIHLLTAVVAWWLRGSPSRALLAGLGVTGAIMLVLSRPEFDALADAASLTREWSVPRFGLTLVLDAEVIPELILFHAIIAVTCLLILLTQGPSRFLAGLFLVLAGYSAIAMTASGLMVMPLLHPILLLPLTAWSPSVYAQRVPSMLRTMLPPLLAIPCFAMANWILLNQIPFDPQNSEFAFRTNALLTAGLVLLCMPYPLSQLQRDEGSGSFILPGVAQQLLYQFTVLNILHGTLQSHPALRDFEPLYTWLGWAAVLTVVWNGLAAFGTQDPRRIWFYASMLNWGMILLVFTLPQEGVWNSILSLFLIRIVSLLACATGLTHLDASRLRVESDWSGLGTSLPWNMALFLSGALGLVGFPLSSGFGHFWITWQFIATVDWQIALVLALGTAFTAFGLIRVLRILLRPMAESTHARELLSQRLQAATLLGILTYLSFVPQAINPILVTLLPRFP